MAPTPSKTRPEPDPSTVIDVETAACAGGVRVTPARKPMTRMRTASRGMRCRDAWVMPTPCGAYGGCRSAGREVLVGAGGVLARPLVQLLAQGGARVVDVQAQAAARVMELPGPVGLL